MWRNDCTTVKLTTHKVWFYVLISYSYYYQNVKDTIYLIRRYIFSQLLSHMFRLHHSQIHELHWNISSGELQLLKHQLTLSLKCLKSISILFIFKLKPTLHCVILNVGGKKKVFHSHKYNTKSRSKFPVGTQFSFTKWGENTKMGNVKRRKLTQNGRIS
jgi:hypothetical protein